MDLQNFSLFKSLEQEWTCFLSKSPIKEPFMTERGFTYEKNYLERWFQQNDIEPHTGEKVDKTKIVPNIMLKKVMEKIYNDLPKIEDKLIEKNQIISNLNEDIESLRKDLQREQNLNETNQEILRSTNQKSEKIKKIQKEENSRKIELRQKINEQSIQIMNNIRLIKTLQTRQEQLMQQNLVQKQKIQQLEQTIASQKQQESMAQSCNEYYHNLSRAYIDDLTNCLNRILESANKRIKNESRLRQYLIETVSKKFDRNEEGQKFDFQFQLHEGVKAAIKADQQYLSQQRAPFEYVKKELTEFKEFYSKILFASMTREPSMYLYYTIEKPFAGPQIIHDGEQLKVIPYSIPPTKDQLQAEWNKVIKIDVETPVNDQMWGIFVENVNTKFPWLHELRIRDCQVNSITFDELKKMKSLRKLILENSHFEQATIEELKKFKSELFWVDVQNNQL